MAQAPTDTETAVSETSAFEPAPATRPAKEGSLANPEVLENIPGHVIPILKHEFDDFSNEVGAFLAGNTKEDEFIKFRLRQGVYGQRQPGVNMTRIKLPMGGVTPEQMEAFADAVEEYAPLRKGHITTRQCVQIHHVPLERMSDLLSDISASGLSSREGCGNTVRNVTGDPRAGLLEDELFDITPYAGAYVRYFVRHPTTQLMPRKIKTAFTATDSDAAITQIHDIAFTPRLRTVDGADAAQLTARERENGIAAGELVRGVEIRVGGGTSIMPRLAPVLYDFVELDNGDYLKVAEAVFRIFDRQDFLRVNRARARVKVLVDKIGMDAFREMVDDEISQDWTGERDFDPAPLLMTIDEQSHAPQKPVSIPEPNGDKRAFDRFLATNVEAQKQPGFSTVAVKVDRGDLTPEQFRGLAQIMREYSGGWARTTVQQNLVLRWVRDESVYAVWRALQPLGLSDSGVNEITDAVSCPGTDSCKLGITSSMGLNRAVRERLITMSIEDELTRRIHVKMSGCPNGCSQHHLANIGFYGASIKVGEHTIPAYIPHIAGSYEDGDVRFGQRLKSRLPAKRVPDAVERWLRYYEAERTEGESFNAFAGRVGTAAFEEQIRDLAMPVDFSLENMNFFIDWTKNAPFKVERGEGECAV